MRYGCRERSRPDPSRCGTGSAGSPELRTARALFRPRIHSRAPLAVEPLCKTASALGCPGRTRPAEGSRRKRADDLLGAGIVSTRACRLANENAFTAGSAPRPVRSVGADDGERVYGGLYPGMPVEIEVRLIGLALGFEQPRGVLQECRPDFMRPCGYKHARPELAVGVAVVFASRRRLHIEQRHLLRSTSSSSSWARLKPSMSSLRSARAELRSRTLRQPETRAARARRRASRSEAREYVPLA